MPFQVYKKVKIINTENKITLTNVTKSFGNNKVLDNLNLEIKKGTSIVIIGASGSGKSVLAKLIVGLIKPDSGSIKIDNIETVNLSDSARFALMAKCGFLFQGGGLFDSLTVQENITFAAKKIFNLSEKSLIELATKKLKQVGLSNNVLNLYPGELSGGMKKRVGIARAICTDPDLIFFDEPTSGLDPIMTNVINNLIIKINEIPSITTITITHNMDSAYKIAKEIVLIHNGCIAWKGKKEEIKTTKDPCLNQFIQGLTNGPIKVC